MSDNVFKILNDRIKNALEEGCVPWRKPWIYGADGPKNALSMDTYSGINYFLLSLYPFSSPYWLTFNQIKNMGGKKKSGAQGAPILFFCKKEKENKKTGEKKSYSLARYYKVYNAEEIEGIKFPEISQDGYNQNFENIELAEKILSICQEKTCTIQHIEQGKAFYKPLSHEIVMPEKKQFPKPSDYYATAFHEIGHSTGHYLERDLTNLMGFGSHAYSKEELVAEMVSCYLCAFAGISPLVIENATAYIQNWLGKLRNDPKFVLEAASKAQKAVNFLLEGSELLEKKELEYVA